MMNIYQRYNFDSYMRDGGWFERLAEEYERSGDFLTAKSRYFDAVFAYEKAYDIALRAEDYSANSACLKVNCCRSRAEEMNYKYEDTVRENLSY